MNITITPPDDRIDALTQQLEFANNVIEAMRVKVGKLKAMLPKCEECNGTGMRGIGLHIIECAACGGLGVVAGTGA